MKSLSRILLAFSVIVFAFGAWIHTSAFGRMSDAVAKSDLPPFFGNGFRTLWLQDSVLQIVVVILGLLPITTAILIYHFIGNFIGGHIFLAGGLAAVLGGLMLPANSDQR